MFSFLQCISRHLINFLNITFRYDKHANDAWDNIHAFPSWISWSLTYGTNDGPHPFSSCSDRHQSAPRSWLYQTSCAHNGKYSAAKRRHDHFSANTSWSNVHWYICISISNDFSHKYLIIVTSSKPNGNLWYFLGLPLSASTYSSPIGRSSSSAGTNKPSSLLDIGSNRFHQHLYCPIFPLTNKLVHLHEGQFAFVLSPFLQFHILVLTINVPYGFWAKWLGSASCVQAEIQTAVQQLG